jgi:hypothetical protein
MNKPAKLVIAVAAALFSNEAAADKETSALLKELSRQVSELKAHSDQADARILELENNLDTERKKNRQVYTTGVVTNVAIPPVVVSTNITAAEPKPEAKPVVTLGDAKGTFKIPGTDTSIGIGGYVKLDITESSTGAANAAGLANTPGTGYASGDVALDPRQIPVGQRIGANSQLAFNARETRLWLKSFTPSKWGDVNTYVEMDFYGTGSSYAPLLRHAYGTFGNLMAGQTWSTFLNDTSLPDTLDYNGPVGTAKVRQPLLRWTQPFKVSGESLEFLSAVEAPSSQVFSVTNSPATYTVTYPGANRYPDLVARINYKAEWGNLSLAGMARDIRYTNPIAGVTRDNWGSAVSLAGKINFFALDDFRFSLNYGNVLGRYLTNTPFEDATLNTVTRGLSLINAYSAMIAYQHWWADRWHSTVAYGFEKADLPLSLAYTTLTSQQAESLHANLLWNPLPKATLGLEYIYGARALYDGGNGNISRAQFSAKYSF